MQSIIGFSNYILYPLLTLPSLSYTCNILVLQNFSLISDLNFSLNSSITKTNKFYNKRSHFAQVSLTNIMQNRISLLETLEMIPVYTTISDCRQVLKT